MTRSPLVKVDSKCPIRPEKRYIRRMENAGEGKGGTANSREENRKLSEFRMEIEYVRGAESGPSERGRGS